MAETKHTEGPWEAEGPRVYAKGKRGPLIATCGYLRRVDQEYANARLIAESPDLFGLAQDMLALIEDLADSIRYIDRVQDLEARLRAAISRATGEAA